MMTEMLGMKETSALNISAEQKDCEHGIVGDDNLKTVVPKLSSQRVHEMRELGEWRSETCSELLERSIKPSK